MSTAASLVGLVAARAKRWSFAQAARRGRFLGRLVHRVDRRHRLVALGNLRAAFPDRPEGWHRRVARGAFEQMGRTVTETLWSPRLTVDDLPRVVQTDGLEKLREIAARGNGLLLASGHFGNWELIGVALGLLGVPVSSVARPLDDPRLDALLLGLRTRTGNEVIAKQNAVRGSLRALGSGRAVAVLVDQNTQRHEAVFVPFFHAPAATPPILGHLHARTGAPILPTFAAPHGEGYRLEVEEPVRVPSSDRREAAIAITAEVTARIEARVRRQPEAWLWMHDRWRERPE